MTQMGEDSFVGQSTTGPGQQASRLWIADDEGTEITAPQTVIVGNRVRLRVMGSSSVSDPRWTIVSSAVAGYRQELGGGVVTQLDAAARARSNVSFHFVEGGTESVRVSGVIRGARQTASVEFTVLRPTVARFRLHTSSVNVFDGNFMAGANGRGTEPGVFLAAREPAAHDFGFEGVGPPQQIPGARWSAEVTAPAGGAGHVGFLQLINEHRVFVRNDGTMEFLTSNDVYVLDTGRLVGRAAGRVRYALGAPGDHAPLWIDAGGTATIRMEDSPGHSLSPASRESAAEDQFRVYLVYKSRERDSIWVTLAQRDWAWAGRTERIDPHGLGNSWSRPSAPAWMSPHPADNGEDSTELPTWTQTTSDLAPPHEEAGRGMWQRTPPPGISGGCSVAAPGA